MKTIRHTGTESVPQSRYHEIQYLKELDIKVCPCSKRVKNHEDTKKSLAESPMDTDLLWVKNIPGGTWRNIKITPEFGKEKCGRGWWRKRENRSLLGCVHCEDGNKRKMPSIWKQPQSLFRDPHLCLFLSFSTGLSVQMKVEQSPGVLTLQEGRNSSLICNYSTSIRGVQWFQQNPDGRLISLFYIASGMQQKGRLKSTINSKERYSQLYIRDSQPGDSATYFCAVETQCSADTCSLYTKP